MIDKPVAVVVHKDSVPDTEKVLKTMFDKYDVVFVMDNSEHGNLTDSLKKKYLKKVIVWKTAIPLLFGQSLNIIRKFVIKNGYKAMDFHSKNRVCKYAREVLVKRGQFAIIDSLDECLDNYNLVK